MSELRLDPVTTTESALIQRLHPSLRASFVPLPPADVPLTPEQLASVFAGDVTSVVRDLVRLAHEQRKDSRSLEGANDAA